MSHWLAFELIFFQQRERARELSKLLRVPSQLWLIQQTAVKEFIAWHNVRTQLLRRIPIQVSTMHEVWVHLAGSGDSPEFMQEFSSPRKYKGWNM